jgi:tRNA (guanine26-N2/guanine27-N2)-dimethyltransferase
VDSVLENIELKEGRAKFFLPMSNEFFRSDGKLEPAWLPIFYNPYSSINRDLTVLGIKAFSSLFRKIENFIEPLAGSCVRTIRVVLENDDIEINGYANDISKDAVEYCVKNISLNGLEEKIKVMNEEANFFLHFLLKKGIKQDAVDIDPYGSPINFLDSASKAISNNGLLFVTATDIGTLMGKYKDTSLRRYGSHVYKTDYGREIAARVLIYSVIRAFSSNEKNAYPLFTYYHEHFLKTGFLIKKEKQANKIGFLCIDSNSGYPFDKVILGKDGFKSECSNYIGPIWLGELWNRDFLLKVEDFYRKGKENYSIKLEKDINTMLAESEIENPYYYHIDKIASKLKKNVPKFEKIEEELKKLGYASSRTHFDAKGIKTNAPYDIVFNVIKSL